MKKCIKIFMIFIFFVLILKINIYAKYIYNQEFVAYSLSLKNEKNNDKYSKRENSKEDSKESSGKSNDVRNEEKSRKKANKRNQELEFPKKNSGLKYNPPIIQIIK